MSKISHIIVTIDEQRLYCLDADKQLVGEFPVSTASRGVGNRDGSLQTPLGRHTITQKIGEGLPLNEVFIGREPQGVLSDLMERGVTLPDDIITSRILRLKGEEPGINQGEGIDSYARYIYIHGTPQEDKIGQPASHGCVRMRNQDMLALFEQVEEGCTVLIQETKHE